MEIKTNKQTINEKRERNGSSKWKCEGKQSLPVTEERAQHHETVLHQRDDLRRLSSLQQQLSSGLEVGKGQRLDVPVTDHLVQLGFYVLLLHSRDADVLEEKDIGTVHKGANHVPN